MGFTDKYQYMYQNNWKYRLVDPSLYDLMPAGFTKALHNGHVLSLSNLKHGTQFDTTVV